MVGRSGAPFRDGRTRCLEAPVAFRAGRTAGRVGDRPAAGRTAEQPYHRSVSPRSSGRPGSRASAVVSALLAVVAVAGCAAASFDPTGPCTVDGRAPGGYPELESQLPTRFEDRAPDQVDSGRNCSDAALGTLRRHGVNELRFAGATWAMGSHGGVTLALLDAPNLDPGWVEEFYKTGAEGGRNVVSVSESTADLDAGVVGQRVDVLNGESYQTIVSWSKGSRVAVALVASFVREIQTKAAHDAIVEDALRAYGPG